jgi:hypothetical protein
MFKLLRWEDDHWRWMMMSLSMFLLGDVIARDVRLYAYNLTAAERILVKVGMDFMPLETTRKLNFPISCNVMPK